MINLDVQNLFQIDKPNQSPVLLKGHRSEVSDVAWCQKDLFRVS